MATRKDFYAHNHTELAANTPAAIGGVAGVDVATVVITATLTGNLAVYDGQSTSGALLLFAATPAAGTVYTLNVHTKNGCWVVPGTAGTCSVYWS